MSTGTRLRSEEKRRVRSSPALLVLIPWVLFLSMSVISVGQTFAGHNRIPGNITIHNRAQNIQKVRPTDINAGPSVGNILNVHFFPGLMGYQRGKYRGAAEQMSYVLRHPEYTRMNPRHAEISSHAHYIRGMVLLYHASGLGRLMLATEDFEQSIRWNPKKYASYLELAHLLSTVDQNTQAVAVLQRLLALPPPMEIAQQARKTLQALQSGSKK